MYEIEGWEDLVDRLRAKERVLNESADYLTLVERGAKEEQVERVELVDPDHEGGPAVRYSRWDQVLEAVDRLRQLAIDNAMPSGVTSYRLAVYSPKGDTRLFTGSFLVRQHGSKVGDPAAYGVEEAKASAHVAMTTELTAMMRETHYFMRQGMQLVMVTLRDVQAMGQVHQRAQADRLAEVERNYHKLIDQQATERQRQSDDLARKERIQAGRQMFDTFMGSVKELGQAYMVAEHPELTGLDPELLKLARELPADMVAQLKDPALRKLLQDDDFRKQFIGMLKAVAAQVQDDPPTADGSPPPSTP